MEKVTDLIKKISWVSHSRFQPYLDESDQLEEKAWELYEWNARVASALSEIIHHTEVLLRNSMIEALSDVHALDFPWHSEDDTIPDVAKKLSDRKNSIIASRDDLISNLNLGFWVNLVNNKHWQNEALWNNHLHKAFPNQHIKARLAVADSLKDLNELRNRCAHQDSLLRIDIQVELKKILTLIGWIDTDAQSWIESRSQLGPLIENRPVEPKADSVVIADIEGKNWKCYEMHGAVIIRADLPIAPAEYFGFYHPKRILSYFPHVEDINVPSSWTFDEAKRLRSTGDPFDRKIGNIMSYGLKNGFSIKNSHKIYLLSAMDAPSTRRTSSMRDIQHGEGSGRGKGFVKRPRYFSINSLTRAHNTSEL